MLESLKQEVCKANLDLRAAQHGASAPELDLWSDVAFHAQQAVEKAYKAFLTSRDVPHRKTHSLEELGRQCAGLDSTLTDLVNSAAPLTEYAWKFRYPGESENANREEALLALEIAVTVVHHIAGQIGFPP